jgi:hypothetical protein
MTFSGLGNLKRNAIPRCQLLRLQRLVDDLYAPAERPVPFWLDTMCVPLRRRFRRVAIVDMAKIYKHADKVLVLDGSLLQASTTDSPPIELHMRLMTSGWSQRLWTFHETGLARRLHYQFADRAVTRRQLTDQWLQSLRRYDQQHPSHSGSGPLNLNLAYRSEGRQIGLRILFSDPIARQAITWLKDLESFKDMYFTSDADRLRAITNPLRWRSTSRPEDEAICLAGLLDLTIAQRAFLFKLAPSQRMKQLILCLDSVPADILFVDLPREPSGGFPWIPVSFLSGGFNASMARSCCAQVTGDGLRLSSPGVLLSGQVTSVFEDKRAFMQHQGSHFSISPRNNSDFEWEDYHSSELALILRRPLVYPGSSYGALVMIEARRGDVFMCRFQCPVLVTGRDEQSSLCDTYHAPLASSESCGPEQSWCVG